MLLAFQVTYLGRSHPFFEAQRVDLEEESHSLLTPDSSRALKITAQWSPVPWTLTHREQQVCPPTCHLTKMHLN